MKTYNKKDLVVSENYRTNNYHRTIYDTPDGKGSIWIENDCTPGYGEYTTDIVYPEELNNPYVINNPNTTKWELISFVKEDGEEYNG